MKKILVFGDSNSWGYIPAQGIRYEPNQRWTGIAASILGEDYVITEDSVSGRTTVFEDPLHPKRCGIDNLGYSLLAHNPIDLLVFYLGTNDLKFTDSEGFRKGLTKILDYALNAETILKNEHPFFKGRKRILVVGPSCILPEIAEKRPNHQLAHAAAESNKIAQVAKEVAEAMGLEYVDMSALVIPSPEDCLHLSVASHRKVGEAIAAKIKEIFSE